jgi:hypothetical protein
MRKETLILSLMLLAGPSCSGKDSNDRPELRQEKKYSISREYVQLLFMGLPPSGRYPMYSPIICLKAIEPIKESDVEILKYELIDPDNSTLKADITWRADLDMEPGQDKEMCISTDFYQPDHFNGVPDKFRISIELVDKSTGEKFNFVSGTVYFKSDFDLNKKP